MFENRSIIDKAGRRSQRLTNPVQQLIDGILIGQVTVKRSRTTPQFPDIFCRFNRFCFRVPVVDGDIPPLFCKGQGNNATDPACCTGYNGDFLSFFGHAPIMEITDLNRL